jgi:hypothetical protein
VGLRVTVDGSREPRGLSAGLAVGLKSNPCGSAVGQKLGNCGVLSFGPGNAGAKLTSGRAEGLGKALADGDWLGLPVGGSVKVEGKSDGIDN